MRSRNNRSSNHGESHVRKILTAALLVATLCLGSAVQADEIFLANEDGSTTFDLSGGTSGTIGVYVADDFSIDTGAFLNAFGDNGISITSANVFNPDIVVSGAVVDSRWQSTGNGAPSDDGNDVLDFNGFAVNEGSGILPSQTTGNLFEDTGHVPGIGFLFAELTWELTGNLAAGDVASIELGIGTNLIVDGGVELNPTFGNFTITNAVPEPTAAGLLALGFAGLVARRRR